MLSICIPAYNYINYIPEAIDSCLSQDHDFELIVLDDFDLFNFPSHSINDIKALRDQYSADPRVKWFSNKSKLTIQSNWNKVVNLSNYSYVKLMGADDRLQPGAISKISEMVRAYPKVGLHGHLARIIDIDGCALRMQRPYSAESSHPILMSGVAALKGKLRQSVRFKEPVCNIFKKSAWEKVGGYSAKYRFCFDVHLNMQIMATNECALWNEYLVDLRRHNQSDGAILPASLALSDLQSLVDEILMTIGDDKTNGDLVAANGWLLYRFLELASQRLRRRPLDVWEMFLKNRSILLNNPLVYIQAGRLAATRLLHHDIQQAL